MMLQTLVAIKDMDRRKHTRKTYQTTEKGDTSSSFPRNGTSANVKTTDALLSVQMTWRFEVKTGIRQAACSRAARIRQAACSLLFLPAIDYVMRKKQKRREMASNGSYGLNSTILTSPTTWPCSPIASTKPRTRQRT